MQGRNKGQRKASVTGTDERQDTSKFTCQLFMERLPCTGHCAGSWGHRHEEKGRIPVRLWQCGLLITNHRRLGDFNNEYLVLPVLEGGGGWKSEMRVPARSGSGDGLPPDSQMWSC